MRRANLEGYLLLIFLLLACSANEPRATSPVPTNSAESATPMPAVDEATVEVPSPMPTHTPTLPPMPTSTPDPNAQPCSAGTLEQALTAFDQFESYFTEVEFSVGGSDSPVAPGSLNFFVHMIQEDEIRVVQAVNTTSYSSDVSVIADGWIFSMWADSSNWLQPATAESEEKIFTINNPSILRPEIVAALANVPCERHDEAILQQDGFRFTYNDINELPFQTTYMLPLNEKENALETSVLHIWFSKNDSDILYPAQVKLELHFDNLSSRVTEVVSDINQPFFLVIPNVFREDFRAFAPLMDDAFLTINEDYQFVIETDMSIEEVHQFYQELLVNWEEIGEELIEGEGEVEKLISYSISNVSGAEELVVMSIVERDDKSYVRFFMGE